jgi:hypothetical protein
MKCIKIRLLIVFVLFAYNSQAQSDWEIFKNQSGPLKKWALWHPFKAKRAFKISNEVIRISDSIATTNLLDKDKAGGQIDAFRHAYWMAILQIEIGKNAAYSLGKSYERANYRSFKKGVLEDGIRSDFTSKKMDLFNNKKGLEFSFKGDTRSKNGLIYKIVNAIKRGDLKVIKKDSLGNFLTCNDIIISKAALKKWKNNKCLISSKK